MRPGSTWWGSAGNRGGNSRRQTAKTSYIVGRHGLRSVTNSPGARGDMTATANELRADVAISVPFQRSAPEAVATPNSWRRNYAGALVMIDLVCLLIGAGVAAMSSHVLGTKALPEADYRYLLVFACPGWLLMLAASRAYDLRVL